MRPSLASRQYLTHSRRMARIMCLTGVEHDAYWDGFDLANVSVFLQIDAFGGQSHKIITDMFGIIDSLNYPDRS